MDEQARYRLDKEMTHLILRNTSYDVVRSLVRVLESRHGRTDLTTGLAALVEANDPKPAG